MGEFNNPFIIEKVTKNIFPMGEAHALQRALSEALDELPESMRKRATFRINEIMTRRRVRDIEPTMLIACSITLTATRRATPEEAAELLRDSTP